MGINIRLLYYIFILEKNCHKNGYQECLQWKRLERNKNFNDTSVLINGTLATFRLILVHTMKYWFNPLISVAIHNMSNSSIWVYYYQKYVGAASVKMAKVFIFGVLNEYYLFLFYLKGDRIGLGYCTHLLTN